MTAKPEVLDRMIAVLLDQTEEFGERNEIALTLADHDSDRAVSALVSVAIDPDEPSHLADTCGEALGEIWCRKGAYDRTVIARLQPAAFLLVRAWAAKCHPEWVDEMLRLRRRL